MSKHKLCPTGFAPTPQAFEPWHLHTGTVQLFIVGPGQHAMLACTESYYTGRIGSDEELQIARLALDILSREHGQDKDAGPAEIRAALERARTKILALNPQPCTSTI